MIGRFGTRLHFGETWILSTVLFNRKGFTDRTDRHGLPTDQRSRGLIRRMKFHLTIEYTNAGRAVGRHIHTKLRAQIDQLELCRVNREAFRLLGDACPNLAFKTPGMIWGNQFQVRRSFHDHLSAAVKLQLNDSLPKLHSPGLDCRTSCNLILLCPFHINCPSEPCDPLINRFLFRCVGARANHPCRHSQ